MRPNDPIADFLTRLRNANTRRKEYFDCPSSNIKVAIARILKDEGYIRHHKLVEDDKQHVLRVYLKYGPTGERVIQQIRRSSTPGRRHYVGVTEIPWVLGGMGTSILSTSRGLMTGKAARKANIGGELICTVS